MLFKYFPEVKYDGVAVRDITRHASFITDLRSDPYVFLPYTLNDGESAEDVAYHYYGTVNYTPYVLMANGVVCPYTDWLMTDKNLSRYIIKKYADRSGKTGNDVLRWTADATRFDNIMFFRRSDDYDMIMRTDTYIDTFIPEAQQMAFYTKPETVTYTGMSQDWVPFRIYDWELQKNEDRRTIDLIDKNIIDRVHKDFVAAIRK